MYFSFISVSTSYGYFAIAAKRMKMILNPTENRSSRTKNSLQLPSLLSLTKWMSPEIHIDNFWHMLNTM